MKPFKFRNYRSCIGTQFPPFVHIYIFPTQILCQLHASFKTTNTLMKKIVLFILSIFSLLFSVHAQSVNGKISGSVGDSVGNAIDAASVLLQRETDTAALKTILTNASGKFEFEDIPAGKYRIVASAIGYSRQTSSVVDINSSNTFATIQKIRLQKKAASLE